jgi:hypothetical protein
MVFKRSRDITANWEIYKNVSYGFEVKYPSAWELISPVDESDLRIANYPVEDLSTNPDKVVIEIVSENAKPADIDLLSFVKNQIAQPGEMQPSGNLIATELDGLSLLKIDHSGGDGPDGPGYYIEKSPTEFLFVLVYGESNAQTVNKIISTIKFVK